MSVFFFLNKTIKSLPWLSAMTVRKTNNVSFPAIFYLPICVDSMQVSEFVQDPVHFNGRGSSVYVLSPVRRWELNVNNENKPARVFAAARFTGTVALAKRACFVRFLFLFHWSGNVRGVKSTRFCLPHLGKLSLSSTK